MVTQLARLEIEAVWWIWRGCIQNYYDGCDITRISLEDRRPDPMERHDYDEDSAFPMKKPNFDIFGVPHRTRSQRGWYCVRTPLRTASPSHTCHLSVSLQCASGSDLPIELVEFVGVMIANYAVHVDDRQLMKSCALVCRYWARQFLPLIFLWTTLRSRKQALELRELDRLPRGWFHTLDHGIQLRPSSLHELSWIHIATQTHCSRFIVQLDGPLSPSMKTIRSIHQALPRSLPRSFSEHITWLELINIHFTRFSDLEHLTCELSHLETFRCNQVTWDSLPTTINRARRRRMVRLPEECPQIDMYIVSESWAEACMHLLARYLARNGLLFFSENDLPLVLTLAALLDHAFPSASSIDCMGSDLKVFTEMTTYQWNTDHISIRLNAAERCQVDVQAAVHVNSRGDAVPLQVTVIAVHLISYSPGQDDLWTASNWAALDNIASSLNVMHLVIGLGSRDLLLKFADEIVGISMPLSFSRGSVKYAILRDSKWYKASQDTDILHGTFALVHYEVLAN
ncbi:hypothetical protein EIP86_002066 [Pleurotus ostreatoroseus]|nr:hypothetical protein EIP86_002066 [Pleurotus ostreatoroseus]